MYQTTLEPSNRKEVTRRELHFILADGGVITVYAIEGSARRVRIGAEAPQTVRIHSGKLDLPS